MNAPFPLLANSGAAASAAAAAKLAAQDQATSNPGSGTLRMQVTRLNFFYGKHQALHNISLDVATNRGTALIGPSGCGKSTLLRTLTSMHEPLRHTRVAGRMRLDGAN